MGVGNCLATPLDNSEELLLTSWKEAETIVTYGRLGPARDFVVTPQRLESLVLAPSRWCRRCTLC